MKTLTLCYFPDGILFQKCEPVPEVTDEIKALAQDMILTMMIEKGIGLAAPQVGRAIRMFVVDVEWSGGAEQANPYVFINPTVEGIPAPGEEAPRKVPATEGCLSFPGERFDMERWKFIRVTATDLEGKPFTLEADGILGVAIQHENDHLDGKTVGASLSWLKRDMMKKRILKRRKGRR